MIDIAEIHRELWTELRRMLCDDVPAAAAEHGMTRTAYLKNMHLAGQYAAAFDVEYETGGGLSRVAEHYDATVQEQIIADAIVPSDQDASKMYMEAHRVDCAGRSEGYKLSKLLRYFLGRWPELTDPVIEDGTLPDAPPFEVGPWQESEKVAAGSSEPFGFKAGAERIRQKKQAEGAEPEQTPVYVEIDLAARTLTVGTDTFTPSDRVWEFLKELADAKRHSLPEPKHKDWKSAVDMLRRKIGKENLSRVIESTQSGYKLGADVTLKGGGQVGIRPTRQSR